VVTSERQVGEGSRESGASLILALVFLVVVSLVVVGLDRWVGADLGNSVKFVSAQSFRSAANSTNELATQYVRYNFISDSLNASPPVPCWTGPSTPSTMTFNGETVAAWCSTLWLANLGEPSIRLVTISTCLSSTTAAKCAALPLAQTIITVGDFDLSSGSVSCTPLANAASNSGRTCGSTLTIDTWSFGAQPPIVSGASTVSGSCSSGTPLSISGQGFTQATGVYFLLASSLSGDTAIPASSYTINGDSAISACSPSGTQTAYAVVVTPSGWNQLTAAAKVTY
jgi:hypothetical protein